MMICSGVLQSEATQMSLALEVFLMSGALPGNCPFPDTVGDGNWFPLGDLKKTTGTSTEKTKDAGETNDDDDDDDNDDEDDDEEGSSGDDDDDEEAGVNGYGGSDDDDEDGDDDDEEDDDEEEDDDGEQPQLPLKKKK